LLRFSSVPCYLRRLHLFYNFLLHLVCDMDTVLGVPAVDLEKSAHAQQKIVVSTWVFVVMQSMKWGCGDAARRHAPFNLELKIANIVGQAIGSVVLIICLRLVLDRLHDTRCLGGI